jgi:hypothetical protein
VVEACGAWPVGCLDDVYGYLPTDEQVRRGGYEVDGFRAAFGLKGRFDGRNASALDTLLRETGLRRRFAGSGARACETTPATVPDRVAGIDAAAHDP